MHSLQVQSSVSIVSLKMKFKWGPSIGELNLCWGGLELCQTVVIAGYLHDVTLVPDS